MLFSSTFLPVLLTGHGSGWTCPPGFSMDFSSDSPGCNRDFSIDTPKNDEEEKLKRNDNMEEKNQEEIIKPIDNPNGLRYLMFGKRQEWI